MDLSREELVISIWDLYKDIYMIRPKGVDFNNMTTDDLEDMYQCLATILNNNNIEDRC